MISPLFRGADPFLELAFRLLPVRFGEIYRFAFPSSLKLESETYLKLKPERWLILKIWMSMKCI
jgi:hypothetical protein